MLRGLLALTLLVVITVLGLPLYLAGLGSVPPPEPGAAQGDLPIRVYLHEEDRLVVIPLEAYVRGVVAAEMPASFPLEALKAQAVVARTYAVRRMRVFGGEGCDRHPAADVCTDPGVHQAYARDEVLRRRWGLRYATYRQLMDQAVEATRGLILMYDGRPIDAVYHSTSGGRTEAAEHVWGRPVPYLTSVPSPYEERSPRIVQTVQLTWSELRQHLDLDDDVAAAASGGGGPAVMEALETAPSGRIKRLRIGPVALDARDVRQRLQLNSTWFSWEADAAGVTFLVRGYGHGVGMSQYGAEGMARRGSSFDAILAHYYPGTTLRPIFVE